jgi:flagella basal body P-ring formation protein FlgA
MRHEIDRSVMVKLQRLRLALLATGVLVLLIAAALRTVQAEGYQSPQSIRTAILDFAARQDFGGSEQAEVEVGQIDPRLRLQSCAHPLEVFFNSQQRRQMARAFVGVRCSEPAPWKIYVPISLRVFGEVAVASRPLQRGQVLRSRDLRFVRRNLAELPGGYLTRPEEVVGMELSRPTPAGAVISPLALQQPDLIHRGEQVALIIDSSAISVRMRGKALADAALGERLRVKNTSSGRVVEGVVSAPGEVTVNHR